MSIYFNFILFFAIKSKIPNYVQYFETRSMRNERYNCFRPSCCLMLSHTPIILVIAFIFNNAIDTSCIIERHYFFLPNSQTTFVNRPALGVSPPGDWTELLNGQLLSVILIYFSINYPFNRLLHMKKITWVLHYFRHSFIFFKISSFMIILDFSYTVSFAVSFTKTHQT